MLNNFHKRSISKKKQLDKGSLRDTTITLTLDETNPDTSSIDR